MMLPLFPKEVSIEFNFWFVTKNYEINLLNNSVLDNKGGVL